MKTFKFKLQQCTLISVFQGLFFRTVLMYVWNELSNPKTYHIHCTQGKGKSFQTSLPKQGLIKYSFFSLSGEMLAPVPPPSQHSHLATSLKAFSHFWLLSRGSLKSVPIVQSVQDSFQQCFCGDWIGNPESSVLSVFT